MNAIAPSEEAWRIVYAVEQALLDHLKEVQVAKQHWRMATHSTKHNNPVALERANERFRVAFSASLRVYLLALKEIDERK